NPSQRLPRPMQPFTLFAFRSTTLESLASAQVVGKVALQRWVDAVQGRSWDRRKIFGESM
ncbi:MAG: hypothetical protein J2P36_12280, partial [Ktedonobacteraceae bacterium]|nr:hypothetical protein [Ktedonobacteraceae bacterium]